MKNHKNLKINTISPDLKLVGIEYVNSNSPI